MMAYVFTKYGLLIFDTTVAVITLNYAGQPVDHIGNVLTITTANRFPTDGESPPRATPKPSMPIMFDDLI